MRTLGHRRRVLVLAICCLSLFMVSMDSTVVNLALPSIQHELHASTSSLQWTIDAYIVVLASLLMLSGATADRIGRRRVFQTGLAVFTLGSLLCSLAPNAGSLVGFRMVQAIGGSMLNPVAMSIITGVFTDPRERARAIGVWGGVFGMSMALGPVVGGALVDSIGWRSIFWVNVPVGLTALVLTALFVPESKAPKPRRIDPVGQVLMVLVLGGLTYGLIEAPHAPLPVTIGCFVVAALAVVAFVPYERRRREPLIDPRFFASIPFSGATLVAVCGFAVLAGFLFLNSIYLQDIRGFSPLHAGLLTLPTALGTFAFSLVSGRLLGSRGARLPLMIAGGALIVSGLLLTRLTADFSLFLLLVSYLVFGVGFGLVNPPITNTAVSGMPRDQAGVAAAVASTSRQVGASLGVAVLGTVATSQIQGSFMAGFAEASHGAWWIMVGCGAVVLALGYVTTTRLARRTTFDEIETVEVGSR